MEQEEVEKEGSRVRGPGGESAGVVRWLVRLAGKRDRSGREREKQERSERENSSARYVHVGLKGGVESPSPSSSSPSSS